MAFLKPSILSTVLKRSYHGRALIGKREVVGHGMNGEWTYMDRTDFPFPAVRWEEPNAKIEAIIQKEKGDWKNLTLEEKKALYRYSFRQTFSEINAPTGEWKFITGIVLMGLSVSMWYFIFIKKYAMGPLPESCSEESKEAQLKRMIALRVNPVEGISSKWDYENNRWK